MELLCDEDGFFYLEDRLGAIAGVVGAPTGEIQDDGFVGHAELQGILTHRAGLIVVNKAVISAHQYFLDFSGEKQLCGCGNPVTQHRGGAAISTQPGAEDDGNAL